MIYNIPKPEISQAFTIRDIHRIREWEHERLKDATREEYHADTNRRTDEALKRLGLVPRFVSTTEQKMTTNNNKF